MSSSDTALHRTSYLTGTPIMSDLVEHVVSALRSEHRLVTAYHLQTNATEHLNCTNDSKSVHMFVTNTPLWTSSFPRSVLLYALYLTRPQVSAPLWCCRGGVGDPGWPHHSVHSWWDGWYWCSLPEMLEGLASGGASHCPSAPFWESQTSVAL